ncbi:MAG: hypothetical protein KatS3mg126_0635 [Lysobacteraceae bacterium]|nr:MAG: hypothetical protein KatS3mg126_0635 [Xanthomonadaceae bacterium]
MIFAEVILDKLLAVCGRFPKERIDCVNIRDVADCLERGSGGLMITAHVGCLELCQVAAEQVAGLRLNVLVHTRHAERFNELLSRLGPRRNVRLLQVTEIGVHTAADLADRIAAGEFVAIVGDRVPVGGGRVTVRPFLGVPAPFPQGPWILAALLGCPVFFISCLRHPENAGYRIDASLVAERVFLPRKQRDDALVPYIDAYARWLEHLVAIDPYQWFNFFDFWRQPAHVRT